MALILDIAAIAVFAFFLWRGKRRGFIKTVAGILALILAFWGANLLSDLTAPAITDQYVAPWIHDLLGPKIDAEDPQTPTEFESVLIDIGIPRGMASDLTSARPVSELAENAASSIAADLTELVLSIIYFVVLLLLLKLIFKAIDKIFDLPGLKFANNTLGLVCGGIFGLLFVYFLTLILCRTGILIDEEIISETYILKHLIAFNPFKL